MLKQSLWNGAIGTVVQIVAQRENNVPGVAPVEMDENEGPRPFPGQRRVIPVPARTATFRGSQGQKTHYNPDYAGLRHYDPQESGASVLPRRRKPGWAGERRT